MARRLATPDVSILDELVGLRLPTDDLAPLADGFYFFSSRGRHPKLACDWSSDVCSSDLRTAEGDAAVPAEWWTLYRDATLEELVAATRANNADIRLAAAQVEEAEAVLRQARAALFPEITGGPPRSRPPVDPLPPPPPVGGLGRPDTPP